MNRKAVWLPLLAFIVLAGILLWQLLRNASGDTPDKLESVLIGKPVPAFTLPALDKPGEQYTQALLRQGKPLLLNVWATWCPTCQAEHAFLKTLAAEGVTVIGVNYKDEPQRAQQWLQQLGNPYTAVIDDRQGMLGLDLGVYGAPETFLIDGDGKIRYRFAGALTPQVWTETLRPLYARWQQEAR